MKDRIEKLKNLADNIQAAKLGKRGKDNHVNSYTVISEYHEWRAETEDLFFQVFGDSNPQFQEFRTLPKSGNGYTLMHSFDQQYPIFKILIKKIESGEISLKKESMGKISRSLEKSEKTVFISHAVSDKEIINAFVDLVLLGGLSIQIDQIFCVSTDGAKIKSGTDWRNAIKESLDSSRIIFLIITPNYKESEFCLCEMGAAWMTDAHVLPLILDPINYKTVGVIQEPNQIEKLLDESSLDRIKDIVQEVLNIPSSLVKSDRWTVKKREFISTVKRQIAANPFPSPMDRDTFNKIQTENGELNSTIDSLVNDKSNLESLIKDILKTKDKTEAKKVIKKHRPNSDYEEFQEVVNKAKKILQNFSPIVRGIIFKSYTGKNITINWQAYKDDIDEAFANDFITDELEADWDTTSEMRKMYDLLSNLTEILNRTLDDSFDDSFSQDYSAPIKINNKAFWESVFETVLRF